MRRLLIFVLIGLMSCASFGVEYDRREDVIYGRKDGMALTMDVIAPKTKSNGKGVLLMVSGGWISTHDILKPPLIEGFLAELLSRGYTVFAVVHGSQPRYTIPDVLADVHRAVRFVRFHVKDYQIDPDHLGVFGGSAGGHLSLMLGVAPSEPKVDAPDPVDRVSDKVQAVAAFFPPTDFLNYGTPGNIALGRGVLAPYKAAFDFRELDPTTHAYVQITDEKRIEEIGKQISPIYHIDSGDAPTLIIHGDADVLVPIQQSQTFMEKLKAANVPGELLVVPKAGHGFVDLPNHMKRIADWFDKYLAPIADSTTKP